MACKYFHGPGIKPHYDKTIHVILQLVCDIADGPICCMYHKIYDYQPMR